MAYQSRHSGRDPLQSSQVHPFTGNAVGEQTSQSITEVTLSRLGAADDNRTLRDGSGLSGKVHVTRDGTVSVHFRYRFDGQSREATLGAWPRDSLDAIRERFEETTLRVSRGTDPAGQKKAVAAKLRLEQASIEQQREQRLTMQAMYDAWHPEALADYTPKSRRGIERMFELHFLPSTASICVTDISDLHVRNALKTLVAAGKSATAVNLRTWLATLFAWGQRRKPWRGLIEVNPVDSVNLDRLLPPDFMGYCDRALSEDEVCELRGRFQAIRTAFDFCTGSRRGLATPLPREHELAVWLMLSTLVRINEICAAPWTNVKFAQATWFIPAERAKGRRALTIHLSSFSVRLLRELHALTGHTPWLLPGGKNRPVATSVIQNAIGYRQSIDRNWGRKTLISEVSGRSLVLPGGPWSAHDLRRTGATFMLACGVADDVVERCLNHAVTTKARMKRLNPALLRTYHQYTYEPEMRDAWHRLGQYLEQLDTPAAPRIAGADTVAVNDAPQAGLLDAA
ncbi:tyrosine-type recombinase/integrase [Paraburkholderia saeva]|nr:site-specific integrase [Paraburkholderia saeva]